MLASIIELYQDIVEENMECIKLATHFIEKDEIQHYNFVSGELKVLNTIGGKLQKILEEEGVLNAEDK